MKNFEQQFNNPELADPGSIKEEKKSPTQILESVKDPDKEVAYVSFPGKGMKDVSKERYEGSVKLDIEAIDKFAKSNGGNYRLLHTHPRTESSLEYNHSLPSSTDLLNFILKRNMETCRVAQQDPLTGKVAGYFIIKKTKETPRFTMIPVFGGIDGSKEEKEWRRTHPEDSKLDDELFKAIDLYDRAAYYEGNTQSGKVKQLALKEFTNTYKLLLRMVPNSGYTYEEGVGFFKITSEPDY